MNNGVIFASGLTLGLGIGIVSGIVWQKRKDKAEIDAINKSYHDIFEKQRKKIEELENTEVSSLDVPEIVVKAPTNDISEEELKEAFGKNYAYNYNAHSASVSDDPLMPKTDKASIKEPEPRELNLEPHPVDSDEEELTEEEADLINGFFDSAEREFVRQDPPKIIKDSEYGQDGRYAESNLLYYPDKDILCDENGEEIFNPETVVGNTLDKFNFRTNDQDHMCIRNFRLGLDYWISKQDIPYIPAD